MKILHVVTSMNPENGGVAQAIRNIIFNNFYVENEVVCFDDKNDDYGISDNFVIHKLGKGKTSFQYHSKFADWLCNNMQYFTHIIVHGIWQYHNYCVYKVNKSLKGHVKPKIIIMPHGMLDPYFQKDPSRKLKAFRNEIVWRLTEKKAINYANALFFTCEEELILARTTFKKYFPLKEIVVGLGVLPPPVFKNEMTVSFQRKVPEIKKYWLFLSRIHPKKGVDLLIEAYNQLRSEKHMVPDLVIAGPINSEYAQEMIVKAKDNPQIFFTGMLQEDIKWGAFYGCELYILPSYQENFGIALVEAMACQKPVLITKHINIWREIEKGKAGWVLNELNVESLKAKFLEILQLQDETLLQIGNLANQTFEEKFDVKRCAEKFIKGIEELNNDK